MVPEGFLEEALCTKVILPSWQQEWALATEGLGPSLFPGEDFMLVSWASQGEKAPQLLKGGLSPKNKIFQRMARPVRPQVSFASS